MKRVIHLTENIFYKLFLIEATSEEIYQKYYSDIPYETYCQILQLDPTYRNNRMGKYTKWLLNIYRKGTFKEGDFWEARELLPVYDKYRNVIETKDIMKLNSIGELYQVVQPYMGGDKATSKSDAARKIKNGAEKVYEDDQWAIVIPHTKEAAILYGKHTKWCTAAERSGNMFDYYNNEGPLYINIDKVNNRKYQFHFESSQFMDEQNIDVRNEAKQEDANKSIADLIGMSQGAREYYWNKLGYKSGVVVLSSEEDIKLCVDNFNANRGNIIGMLECFDEVLHQTQNTNDHLSNEEAKEMFSENPEKNNLFTVYKRNKANMIDLLNEKLLLKDWVDYAFLCNDDKLIKLKNGNLYTLLDLNGKPILNDKWYKRIDTTHDLKFVGAESNDYCELYVLNGNRYENCKIKLRMLDFNSIRSSFYRFIACKTTDAFGMYDLFISKTDCKPITFSDLKKKLKEYAVHYKFDKNTTANKVIYDFETDVLGINHKSLTGYTSSCPTMNEYMRRILINGIINT